MDQYLAPESKRPMFDEWRVLRIGHVVRVKSWPSELHQNEMHADTYELYQWLIQSRSELRIVEVDEAGMPWGELRRDINGVEHWDKILLNHSGLEIVQSS